MPNIGSRLRNYTLGPVQGHRESTRWPGVDRTERDRPHCHEHGAQDGRGRRGSRKKQIATLTNWEGQTIAAVATVPSVPAKVVATRNTFCSTEIQDARHFEHEGA